MSITNQDIFLISNSQNTKPEIQWLTIESGTMLWVSQHQCGKRAQVVRVYDASPREWGEGYITLYSLDNYAN